MVRAAPRHDRDAGGPADVLAAKAVLRQDVWSAMRAAKVARFPGAAGRIPNFTGAEAAAERLRALRFQSLAQRAQDAALADPGFTRQQHHLAFAIPCLRPPAKQQVQFLPAANQRR